VCVFADGALARRIEGAEASLSADITAAVIRRGSVDGAFMRPIAGGLAVYTGADSPVTKVIGSGLDGPPGAADLDLLEAAYFARGAAVRAEVATLADPGMVRMLTTRGYVLNGFENVLGRRLDRLEDAPAPPDALNIEGAPEPREWMEILLDGFEAPDTGVPSAPGESFPRAALERIFADMAEATGFRRYVARLHGTAAAGAGMRVFDGVAQLCGATTLPPFRRRGVQTAMLFARLREAAASGCDVAVVTTEPGSKSQENAQRAGFAVLYPRAVLIKAPPGAEA
jgi:hypothetical protein